MTGTEIQELAAAGDVRTGCDDWAELQLYVAALRAIRADLTDDPQRPGFMPGYVQACDDIAAWMNARG